MLTLHTCFTGHLISPLGLFLSLSLPVPIVSGLALRFPVSVREFDTYRSDASEHIAFELPAWWRLIYVLDDKQAVDRLAFYVLWCGCLTLLVLNMIKEWRDRQTDRHLYKGVGMKEKDSERVRGRVIEKELLSNGAKSGGIIPSELQQVRVTSHGLFLICSILILL